MGLKKDLGQLFRTASGDELVQQVSGVVAALKIQISGRESLGYIGLVPSLTPVVFGTL